MANVVRLSTINLVRSLRSAFQYTDERAPLLEGGQSLVEIELEEKGPHGGTQASASQDPNTHRLDISPFKLKFLQESKDALKRVTKSLVDKGFITKFDWQTRSVQLTPIEGEGGDWNRALQHIEKSLVEMDLSKEELDYVDNMGIPTGLDVPGEVCVLLVRVGEGLKMVGLNDEMTTLSNVIDTSMKRAKEAQEQMFTIDDNTYEYLKNYRWASINKKLKPFKTEAVLIKKASEKNGVLVKGMLPGFDEARAIVNEEIEAVETLDLRLDAGMIMTVVSGIVMETRTKYDCSINYKQNFDGHSEASTNNSQPMKLSVMENKITRIHVVTNAIEKQQADIIVNTTNKTLKLSEGRGVSWSILQAAGPSIQAELNRKHPKGIQHGEVVESSPGNIKTCKTIFHGALPEFPTKPDTSAEEDCFKWLISLVFHCLIRASHSTRDVTSIAFPALGTGALNFPVQHVVQIMYRAINLYNKKHEHPPIRDVYLVIFPDTKLEVKQLFLAHKITHHLQTRHVGSLEEVHKEKRHSNTEPPKYELRVQVGDILLQIVNGDISSCCVVTDAVLVLWTNDNIQACTNPGLTCTNRGKNDWKCSSFLRELPEAVSTADSTNLPGTTLIHAYCKKSAGSPFVDAVVKGIQTAARLKCTSLVVTLPADGQHANGPRILAEVVFNALKKSQSKLHLVTVVIEDEMAFTSFGEKIASLTNKFLPPASVDKTPLASELWQDIFSGHATMSFKDYKSRVAETTEDSFLLITSNSMENNRKAAGHIKRLLNERLHKNVQEII